MSSETGRGGPPRGKDRPRGGPPAGRGGRGKDKGGRGDRKGGLKGRDRPDRSDSGGYRVLQELPHLEKALSTGDFTKQKEPLESLLKALRPLHLKSLDQLDLNTRGRLLTTLMRIQRQTKPPAPEAPPTEAPPAPDAPAEAPPEAAAPPESAPAEAAPPESAPAEAGDAAETAQPESPPAAEPAPAALAAPEPEKAPPPEAPTPPDKLAAYQDALFLVGQIWRAAGEEARAQVAFEASGRAPSAHAPERERERERPEEPGAPKGDWQERALKLAESGRTRDAARLYDQHKAYPEAAKLFEAGNDPRGALRAYLGAKDMESARRLVPLVNPADARAALEKAGAWDLLMESYAKAQDFGNVAKLYERARQFDQAALAWERAGKLPNARKAYDRAKDASGADRVRALEVADLIKRGDRLGAATLLLSGGKRPEAVAVLSALPPPKAFEFLQRIKLTEEAQALAKQELSKADQENRPAVRARWLEQMGEFASAAEAWEKAARRDKALPLYEKAESWAKAAALAEALGQREKAAELFRKAGDEAAAERLSKAVAAPVQAPETTQPQDQRGQ